MVVLALLGWLLPFVAAAAGHPALRGNGEAARTARDVQKGTAGGAALARSIVAVDEGAFPAAAALVVSLGYLAIWAIRRASPATTQTRPARPGAAGAMLAAALAGHFAASTAILLGAPLAVAVGAGSMVTLLGVAAGTWGGAFEKNDSPLPLSPGRLRLVALFAAGLLLSAAAFPLDIALAVLSRKPQFPESWFPIAVHFGAHGGLFTALAASASLAAAVLALEFARSRSGGTSFGAWVVLVPATTLLLGPMSPFKGAAAAFAAHALCRAGAGPILRTAAVLAPTAALIAAALAY